MSEKIPDIKSVRTLTIFLGKLGIKSLRYSYTTFPTYGNPQPEIVQRYGWGLKDAKDYVEKKYTYFVEDEYVVKD